MGNIKRNYRDWHQSSDSGEYLVSDYHNWRSFITTERPRKKVETKVLIIFLLDLLGVVWGTKSIFTFINNTKEAILFILVVAYAIVRIYYKVVFSELRRKREQYEVDKLNGHKKAP